MLKPKANFHIVENKVFVFVFLCLSFLKKSLASENKKKEKKDGRGKRKFNSMPPNFTQRKVGAFIE